ncbi:MAG: SpoIVB peptidase [Clostridia bacterium]|nr:SpoIVB peptidase [Clostridia bacterium]
MLQNKARKISSFALIVAVLIVSFGTLGVSAARKTDEVLLGGVPFGVRFELEGVAVVGFCDVDSNGRSVNPAKTAGLKLGDVIIGINGKRIGGVEELTSLIDQSRGSPTKLQIMRSENQMELTLNAAFSNSEKRYKAGIWVKDNGAGIGTVTYILDDGTFAGLGHGICDAESGNLINMRSGKVSDVTVSGIVKGTEGKPGELKGYFTQGRSGVLLSNTDCGVFGVLTDQGSPDRPRVKIAPSDQVKEGTATVVCTLDDNTVGEYTAEIKNICHGEKGNKCFTVKITDSRLIERTGGIVQGMSGSPILQNGKLVGAVTHVLINDPTMGYGIFIENMLNATQTPMAKAS